MTAEGGGERADAVEAHREADLRDLQVSGSQEVAGALEPAGQQVLVRRLPEGAPELSAEMAWRDVGGTCERLEVEWLGVAAVDDVAGAEQVAGEWIRGHGLDDAERVRWRVIEELGGTIIDSNLYMTLGTGIRAIDER
jgi:hypothetical protein